MIHCVAGLDHFKLTNIADVLFTKVNHAVNGNEVKKKKIIILARNKIHKKRDTINLWWPIKKVTSKKLPKMFLAVYHF